MRTGKKILVAIVVAAVFGSVAGVTFEGTSYLMQNALGVTPSVSESQVNNAEPSPAPVDIAPAVTVPSEPEVSAAPATSLAVSNVPDVVNAAMPSLVSITTMSIQEYRMWGYTKQYESEGAGSGIIVSTNDDYLYVMTNNHVVSGANEVTVTFVDDATVSAEIKGTDPSKDLAVVQVKLSDIEPETMQAISVAKMGDSDSLVVGQDCIAIGNALGYGQSVSTGVISALDRTVTTQDTTTGEKYSNSLIQTDAAINPGNSGGALLDSQGRLIGINSAKSAANMTEGMGYAIPINTAKPIIENLITRVKVTEENRGFLGIAGYDVTSADSQRYNIPMGVYIAQVHEGSPAEQAGLELRDVIMSFNGTPVHSVDDITALLEYLPAGTSVDVVVAKSNNSYEEETVTIVLATKVS